MASGGSDRSTRMSAEDYRLKYEILAKLFKVHKIEISHAIEAQFPFFETLRDRGLITDEKYEECEESLKKLSYLPKMVYDVLSELEEKYLLPLLKILFSKVIMKSYPGLNGIWKGFRDGAGENPHPSLSCLFQDPSNNAGTAPPENGPSEHFSETQLINMKKKHITHDKSNALESQQANEQCAQESDPVVISSAASKKFDDGDKLALPQASTSALTREPESMDLIKSPTSGNMHCKRVRSPEASLGFSAEKRPEAGSSAARSGADQEGPVDPGKSPTSQKAKKKRWAKKHEEEFVDFHSKILPVTCGEMKGMLYKNKLEEGSTVKCIKAKDGNWFTPQEFEAAGNYKTSRNWKNTVRCGGKTLKRLMEEGKLPTPPTKYIKKKKSERPEACEICQYGEDLFGCDTCSRFFHGYCHLLPVQTERPLRRPWSCTFCRIKESSGTQQCHGESEVLARLMGPEEQLKCEFLLLSVYCHSDNISFEQMQQDKYSVETYRCMDNFMMLDKIKKNLSEQCYPNVESFMSEMRLIFQNHRAFNKDHALYLMGINLEAEFEQNFKKVFAIQETKQEHIDNKLKLGDNI